MTNHDSSRVRDALDEALNERDALREALFQVLVNLGEDTDGITTGARWDAVVTPKLADSVPQMVADYRREAESESDEYARLTERQSALLTATINALRGDPPALTQWSHHDVVELAAEIREVGENAVKEMHARELHHFEVEEENARLRGDNARLRTATLDSVALADMARQGIKP